MELSGFALEGPSTPTPYADVIRGTRLQDGAAVRVELLRTTDPAVGARLAAASERLRRADGRHLVRVRQVLADPPALVREDVPGRPPDPADPVRVVADVLDALADLHALGLAHGALTAQDVLLDSSVPLRPVVRLTGWGVAALLSPAPPDPAEDVRAAGRLLEQLAGGLPPAAAALVAVDPGARPTAAQARDLLRQLQGLPATPAPVRARPAPSLRSPRPGALVLAALAVLGLGVLGGRQIAGAGGPDELPRPSTARPQQTGPYVLPAVQRPDGLVLERTWLLEQEGAVLRATTVVRNPTPQVLSAGVDEVVPKTIADDVDDLAFTPGPDAIVERDPVVRFNVRGLRPGGSTTWTYVVRLPEAVQREALPALAADADTARAAYEQRLAALRVTPSGSPAPGAPAPTPTS